MIDFIIRFMFITVLMILLLSSVIVPIFLIQTVEIKEIAEICSFTDSSELLLKRIKLILYEISEVII